MYEKVVADAGFFCCNLPNVSWKHSVADVTEDTVFFSLFRFALGQTFQYSVLKIFFQGHLAFLLTAHEIITWK